MFTRTATRAQPKLQATTSSFRLMTSEEVRVTRSLSVVFAHGSPADAVQQASGSPRLLPPHQASRTRKGLTRTSDGLGRVQLGSNCDVAVVAHPASDQHLAVLQQRCCVVGMGDVQAAGGRPGAAGRIVEFGAGKVAVVVAPGDQHLAAREQCCCVAGPGLVHVASRRPGARGRIAATADYEFSRPRSTMCCHPERMSRSPELAKGKGLSRWADPSLRSG